MAAKPELLFRHFSGRKKLSIILTDWNACHSFHALEYLNRQTASRDLFELIWVEFYDRKPEQIQRLLGTAGRPKLDRWIVLGYPDDTIVHKHRAYNAGILAASGEICAICDSEAMYRPTFVESIIRAFDETAYAAVHVDAVRNLDRRFYPFNHPVFEEVSGPGCVNWLGTITQGLKSEEDRLHRADYSACLAARRSELLGIGGADEHVDYLGSSSGPYEMTFRLLNRGRRERWLTDEYIYRTWTPNLLRSPNAFHSGPHDGSDIALRARHALSNGRIRPYLENPCMRFGANPRGFEEFLRRALDHPESEWKKANRSTSHPDFAYCIEKNYRGRDLFVHRGEWFALPAGRGFDPNDPAVLRARDEDGIREEVCERSLQPFTPAKPSMARKFVRDLLAEPLHTLPRRAIRGAGRAFGKAILRK